MASAPAGASSARLCSTGSRAPVRGAGGSCGNLSADSRYQKDPPSASARRGGRIADFHPAGWAVAAHDNVILPSADLIPDLAGPPHLEGAVVGYERPNHLNPESTGLSFTGASRRPATR